MIGAEEVVLFFITGIVAGISAGLLGIGGGLFYILLFGLYLGKIDTIESHEVVRLVIANSIFATFFAALSASIKQWRLNNFFFRPVVIIGLVGLIASIGITFLLTKTSFYSRGVFAFVFTLALIPVIIKMIRGNDGKVSNHPDAVPNPKFLGLGFLSGSATALSGLGGGFVMVPILNGLFKIGIKQATSISIGVIVIVSGATSLYNLFFLGSATLDLQFIQGSIVLPMVLPVVLGVLTGAPLGVLWANRIPEKTIRIIFVIFCLLIILRNFKEMWLEWTIT
ncbi:MAG: sulfite exporter TauE/SafE family protein [Saprospiraceae bacterium]|nr:sulfite exporter TauE/SafE family protein [Saprospiraceae bacterium]